MVYGKNQIAFGIDPPGIGSWHRDPDEYRAQPPALRDPQKDFGSFDEGINLQTAPMHPLEGQPVCYDRKITGGGYALFF